MNRSSKELKDNQKYSPQETAALISSSNLPDNVLTKFRTAENKKFGHNRYASHKKVVAAREQILPIDRLTQNLDYLTSPAFPDCCPVCIFLFHLFYIFYLLRAFYRFNIPKGQGGGLL